MGRLARHPAPNTNAMNDYPTTYYLPPRPHSYARFGSTNLLAILSLASAFTLSPVAIVLGHLAVGQIRRGGGRGRRLAIAGLVLGYLGCAIILLYAVVGFVAIVLFVNSRVVNGL